MTFTADVWIDGQCWLHRYADKPKCPRAGEYGQPMSRDLETRKIRWCQQHATSLDVRIAPELGS